MEHEHTREGYSPATHLSAQSKSYLEGLGVWRN